MPLPLTVSCFSKIQIGFTFLVPAQPGSPRKRAVKWVCVCAESVSEKKLNRIFGKITSKSVVAARIVSNTWKYDRGLSHLLHDELHCLDVPQRVQYKLCTTVHRCLQHKAPQCMTDCCIHTSDIARRQHLQLQSASYHQLFVS